MHLAVRRKPQATWPWDGPRVFESQGNVPAQSSHLVQQARQFNASKEVSHLRHVGFDAVFQDAEALFSYRALLKAFETAISGFHPGTQIRAMQQNHGL